MSTNPLALVHMYTCTTTKETRKEKYKVGVKISKGRGKKVVSRLLPIAKNFILYFLSPPPLLQQYNPGSSHSSVKPRFSVLVDLSRKLFASFAVN